MTAALWIVSGACALQLAAVVWLASRGRRTALVLDDLGMAFVQLQDEHAQLRERHARLLRQPLRTFSLPIVQRMPEA